MQDDLRVSTSISALAINDLAPVSVPAVGFQPSPSLTVVVDQMTHERQLAASVSTLAVTSVAQLEENSLFSPDPSVSC